MVDNFRELADFIWGVADLLRGDLKRSQFGRVLLPFTLLRRLECVLEPSKAAVLDAAALTETQSASQLSQAVRVPFIHVSTEILT